MVADYVVIALYIAGMLGIGWYGLRLARTKSDYLVAGRRLGWFMYSGTMSAVVLGGASTVGGVKLGYTWGISGAWLVVSIGLGILVLHALFARRLVKLKVYTVSEMLDLRYGGRSTSAISGIVMWAYTLMLTVTSTLAFATVFKVLLDIPEWTGIAIGGGIVVLYSVLGGMWSITLTDIAQFVIKTVGILLVLLPVSVGAAGGFGGMAERLDASFFDFTSIGSGVYCLVYGLAGALIGAAAKVLYPALASAQDAFATIVADLLPAGVRGLVLAAALSAMMSTASGALIACSTVSTTDLMAKLRGKAASSGEDAEVHKNRLTTLVLGLVAIGIAMVVTDVVAALTIAYNILVGGLLVAILGGLFWKRGTRQGAVASMMVGALAAIALMIVDGMEANSPIYWGLGSSLLVYLATPPTPAAVLGHWSERLAGRETVDAEKEFTQ